MGQWVLLTGFEPFGGETINPSAMIAGGLDGWEVQPGVRVKAAVVPVTWEGAVPAAVAEIEGCGEELAAILMLGQAGGNTAIALERVAVNIRAGKDNAGVERAETDLINDGPPAYLSTLPLQKMLEAINGRGVPVVISNSAGTYLCNNLFYGVRHHLATTWRYAKPPPPAGFIHVPYLPQQAVGKSPVPPSMSSLDIETAVRAALEMCRTPP